MPSSICGPIRHKRHALENVNRLATDQGEKFSLCLKEMAPTEQFYYNMTVPTIMNPEPEREEFIPTRQSFLSRLKSWDDQESWRQFFNTYWKLIYVAAV